MEQNNATKKGNKKLLFAGIAIFVALIAVFALVYRFAAPKPTAGAKALTIEVIDDKQETTTYKTRTDAEYLEQALLEIEDLEIEGTRSEEFGLTVYTINGVTADFNTSSNYWAFYVNGESCNYGVSSQPVKDGETYSIIYSSF